MSNQSNKGVYKIVIGVLLMVLIVIFALQNNQDTEVKLWFTTFKSPLIILFLSSSNTNSLVAYPIPNPAFTKSIIKLPNDSILFIML